MARLRRYPTIEERLADGRDAWALATATEPKPGDPPGGWYGHLVALARVRDSEQYLLDTSAGQMARPSKGLLVPSFLMVRLQREFVAGKRVRIIKLPTGVVTYSVRKGDLSYRSQPGWQLSKHNVEIANHIAAIMTMGRRRAGTAG